MFNGVQAEALRAYLVKTGYVVSKRVQKLVIDACGVSDDSFCLILDGIYGQSAVDVTTGIIKEQYLQSLIYSNNEFGIKSLDAISKLLPNLFELIFNNIKLGGGVLKSGKRVSQSQLLEELL